MKKADSGRQLVLMGWAFTGLVLALGLLWLWYYSDTTKIACVPLLAILVLWGLHTDGEEDKVLIALAPAHACLTGGWIMEMFATNGQAVFPGVAIPFIGWGGWRLARQKIHGRNNLKASQDDLFAHIGHELRTPLNALVCAAQLLDRQKLAPEQHKHVLTLLAAGHSMNELLNDLLDISRLRSGGTIATQTRAVPVADLVTELSGLWQASAQAKGLGWQCSLDPRLPEWMQLDPGRLRQILSNLIGNAIRCTDQGQVSLRVCFSPVDAGEILFEVADSGCGFDPEQQNDLFQPFYKGACGGGMGLGLAICSQLAEAVGGRLNVWSKKGRGSSFTLSLPCLEAEKPVDQKIAETEKKKENTSRWTGDKPKFSNLRVLVAEDHPAHRHILTTLLKSVGADPVLSSNGLEALQCLEEGRFDLILMDLRMPGMDGVETVRKIRRLHNNMADIPVIFLTAGISPADRECLLDSGIAAVLPKPVDTGSLYQVMNTVLDAQAQCKQHPQFA